MGFHVSSGHYEFGVPVCMGFRSLESLFADHPLGGTVQQKRRAVLERRSEQFSLQNGLWSALPQPVCLETRSLRCQSTEPIIVQHVVGRWVTA